MAVSFWICCPGSPLTTLAQAQELPLPAAASSVQLPIPELPPLRGENAFSGMIVREVKFAGVEGDNRFQSSLKEVVNDLVGKPLERQRLHNAMLALYATGHFANLQAHAQPATAGGITLTFETIPNFFVGSIASTGAPKHPNDNQIVDATKLQLGEVLTPVKLNQAVERIQNLLKQNGYYRAKVVVSQTPHSQSQLTDLHFGITSHEPALIGVLSLEGDPGYTVEELKTISGLKPGQAATQDRLTKGLQRLRKRYTKQNRLESQIAVADRSYHEDSNTLDYKFRIERGPTVQVTQEGAGISNGKLKKLVPIYEENAVDTDLLNEGRRNIRDYLQTQGYFDAKVNFNQDYQQDRGHLNIIYDVDRGDKHDVMKITFDVTPGQHIAATGNVSYFSEAELRERLQVQAKSVLLAHGRYSQPMMTQDVDSLTALYRSNGFLEAKVEGSVNDNYSGKKGDLEVIYHIAEGPQTKVNKFVILGVKSFDAQQLPALNIAEGQPYSDANITLDRDSIINFYFDKGFPNSQFDAKATPTPNTPNSMDVTFTVEEGQQFFVDRILATTLEFTRPEVVQKQFAIKSGDPLSQSQMGKTQSDLYNLGVFNEVRMAVANPDGDAKYKDVLIQFQEAKRWTFNYGFGLEASTGQPDQSTCQQLAAQGETSVACSQGRTGVSPRFTLDVSRINFRGLAHTLTMQTTIGRLQKRGLVSLEEPRWMGKPNWKLTLTAFYDNSVNVTTFTSERLEGLIQAENQYSRVSRFLYRFDYRRVKASNVVVSPDQVPLFSQPVRVGMPSITYIRDKRDDPIDSRNGNFTTFDIGVSSRVFGSQSSFSRFVISNATYHPFKRKRWVFARQLRIGVEDPIGNDFIPLPERFFAGGANSHRGFALNQAGPRDPQTGTPLGGYGLLVNSMELRTPPVLLPFVGDGLSFAFFNDTGNVFGTSNQMWHSIFRWYQPHKKDCSNQATANLCSYNYMSDSLGVGVRYATPIGPVRVDFGYNLNPSSFPSFTAGPNNEPVFTPQTTRRLNVFFSIGQTF